MYSSLVYQIETQIITMKQTYVRTSKRNPSRILSYIAVYNIDQNHNWDFEKKTNKEKGVRKDKVAAS